MEDSKAILDYSTMGERDLVSYVKIGSAMAFSELYRRSYQPLVDYISFRLNVWDSEDIAQESFLKAYRYISRFRGDSSFATWIRRIAQQLVIRSHRNTPEFVPLDENMASVQKEEDVLQSLERERLLSQLQTFLRTLPPAQREVLLLHIQKGLSYAEISQKTGKKVQTLRKACQRALRKGRGYYKATIQKEAKLQENSR